MDLIQEFALLGTPATTADLSNIEIWGGGYDLYFPRIGSFVNATALLAGILGTKAWVATLARSLVFWQTTVTVRRRRVDAVGHLLFRG